MFQREYPQPMQSGTFGAYPESWVGKQAPDGDANPWAAAPVGSVYNYYNSTTGSTRTYQKRLNNLRDDDWGQIGGCIQKRITRAIMTDGGGTSGTYTLTETIPAGAFVTQTLLSDVTGFTGDTSAVIIVGDGTDTDRYNTGTPDMFTTAVMIAAGVPSGVKEHIVLKAPVVTITSAADFTAVVAGAFTLKIFYIL
jgi:hypothetical protein